MFDYDIIGQIIERRDGQGKYSAINQLPGDVEGTPKIDRKSSRSLRHSKIPRGEFHNSIVVKQIRSYYILF